ncbi:MAG TPA: STAS domain-containing protein [Candidatus Aquilonibacter sp.]|nr:STAS domain-containing protein [Candidatus Aquilonibacter sp.]
MSAGTFHVASRAGETAGVHILSVKGAITHATSAALQEAVAGASARGVIVDLSEVPSVDSMAVGALVRVYVSFSKAGRKLAFVGLNHRVKNVLQIVGVDPLFETYASVSEAESALS